MPNTTINFSFANLTTGRITATPTQAFTTDSGALVVAGKPFALVSIASSAAAIVLPATETQGISYEFLVEEGTSPNFTTVDRFRRIVPNASPINASGLLTQFFAPDALDQSVDAISRRLTVEPYITALSARIPGFTYIPWTSSQVFAQNQFTARGDTIYRYISTTQASNRDPALPTNVVPSAGAVWEVVIKAPAGAGTTTTELAYDAAVFNLRPTDSASRKNIVEAIATVSAPDLSNYARRDQANGWSAIQTFSNRVIVPNRATGDNGQDAASTNFVASAIATISGATALPTPVFWGRRAANVSPSFNTPTVIVWDDIQRGAATNGVVSLPSTGLYLAIVQFWVRLTGVFSSAGGRMQARAIAFQNGVNIGDIWQYEVNEVNGNTEAKVTGIRLFSATANDGYDVRLNINGSNLGGGSMSGQLVGNVNNNLLLLFRVN